MNLPPATRRREHTNSPVLLRSPNLDQSAAGKKSTGPADLVVLKARLLAQGGLKDPLLFNGPLQDIKGDEGEPLPAKLLQRNKEEEVAGGGKCAQKLSAFGQRYLHICNYYKELFRNLGC